MYNLFMVKIGLYNIDIIESVEKYFYDSDVNISKIDSVESIEGFDLVILYDYNKEISEKFLNKTKIINIHPSLLPAFEGKNAIQKAFETGVKVSGITFLDINRNKIIAQYPILIGVETHIDDFLREIINLQKCILPSVIDCIINDKVFDFSDLFNKETNCKSSCTGCKSCDKCKH